MPDVEVKAIYTYVDNPTVDNPYTVDIEVHVERSSARARSGD